MDVREVPVGDSGRDRVAHLVGMSGHMHGPAGRGGVPVQLVHGPVADEHGTRRAPPGDGFGEREEHVGLHGEALL
ncbi:hypothetical protein [Streptomyces europaeiscabiei]|uniref:hypothetical protein n=1 Tax=Streptomyces europaeiscabiei TaxID=146819 RepID=UPI0029A5BF4B|nr:hypothetical protein [Streptomyces europaeiscabiei]MDX3782799.1 hypothetical protein [Streptomyces europaeiscabiei]